MTDHPVANATICRWLGYNSRTGGQPSRRFFPWRRIFYQTISSRSERYGQAETFPLAQARDGEARPVLTNAVRHEREGSSPAIMCSADAPAAGIEEELLQAKKAAEEANQAKAQFLSMMSHELRTPMNAILGFGQLLEMDPLDPQQAENVGNILQAGRHLLGLINEVLDLSRIEAGHLEISPEPVPVSEVMHEAFEMARPLASKADIQIQLLPGPDDKSFVLADRGRLHQILLNLLANGIKYNRSQGSVFLACERSPHGLDEGIGERLRFVVRDTGAGIAEDKLGKLFVPFERLDAEGSEIEGTGLGLSLCKRLAEAMGGQIGVRSTVGEGSSFWVEFPIAPKAAEIGNALASEEATGSDTPAATSLVLYIEDNASNLTLLQSILSRRPAVRLLPAVTGEAGLHLARAHFPDLILLDLQLPDMAGDAVIQQLRADERTRHIPIVTLSADATPQQVAHLLKSGAFDCLAKPLDVQKFLQVLDDLIEKQRPT
jgi:signal transduction histidine kinase/ActR/RegA family two-component response regulator